jgi:hypothetical protein
LALPSSVLGPVDLAALFWLAWFCLSESSMVNPFGYECIPKGAESELPAKMWGFWAEKYGLDWLLKMLYWLSAI